MKNILTTSLAVALLAVGSLPAQTFTTNRTPVGMEHNLLFFAQQSYTVTQSGGAQVSLPMMFDGRFEPSYTDVGPTPSDPTVILIQGLPGIHTQGGAWVGWSTRYWEASRFKIEGYDTYAGANTWRTIADYSATNYSGFSFVAEVPGGAYEKLKFTFYSATGDSGRLGLSELFFIHPEAVSPYQQLIGWTRNGSQLYFASGNVGIGTASPQQLLHVSGASPQFLIRSTGPGLRGLWTKVDDSLGAVVFDSSYNNTGAYPMLFNIGGGEIVRFATNGNVGIGTTNPTQKLSVNGTVQAKEVVVQTGWSDYVFNESYQLSALSDVERYVKNEKHLPGIPSAQEVAERGISLGEMQSKLLAKIEELTLHQIEQEKELTAQRTILSEQAAEITALKAENARLNRRLD